jgi:phosphoribulokinase
VIHVRNLEKLEVDFRYLLEMLEGSFMSNPETIVVPSGKMIFAMQLVINPAISRLIRKR